MTVYPQQLHLAVRKYRIDPQIRRNDGGNIMAANLSVAVVTQLDGIFVYFLEIQMKPAIKYDSVGVFDITLSQIVV